MSEQTSEQPNTSKNEEFGGSNTKGTEAEDMPPEAREDKVLQFFVDHDFPLPPKALFRAMKVSEGITFSYSTVQNILSRLLEEGYVCRLNKDKLDEGILEPLPEGESGRRTYYFITEKGRERLERSD